MATVYEAAGGAAGMLRLDQALSDIDLADDPLRPVLHDYLVWATGESVFRHDESADDVPDGMRIPQWSWDGPQS